MDYNTIVEEVMDRLNLSSSEAQDRIGRGVNRVYRRVTSAIGLELSRRTTSSETVTIGSSSVTFEDTEKVINVVNRNVTPYKTLKEVTIEEIEEEMPFSSSDSPTKWATFSHTSNSVTILINRLPATAFILHADVHATASILADIDEPAFPESFHDVIVEGVLADELRKMEKPQLANLALQQYERILSDLRMWIAKSAYKDIYQGKTYLESDINSRWYNGD